jgi:hypothetical protein
MIGGFLPCRTGVRLDCFNGGGFSLHTPYTQGVSGGRCGAQIPMIGFTWVGVKAHVIITGGYRYERSWGSG